MIERLKHWMGHKKVKALQIEVMELSTSSVSASQWPLQLTRLITEIPKRHLHSVYTVRKAMDTQLIANVGKGRELIQCWDQANHWFAEGRDVPAHFTNNRFTPEELKKVYLDDYLVNNKQPFPLLEFLEQLEKCIELHLNITVTVDGMYYHRAYTKLYRETYNILKDIIVNA